MKILIAKDLSTKDALEKLNNFLEEQCKGFDVVSNVATLEIMLSSKDKGECDKNDCFVVLQQKEVEEMLDKIKPELEKDIHDRMWKYLAESITKIDAEILDCTKEKMTIERSPFGNKEKIKEIDNKLSYFYVQQKIYHDVQLGLNEDDFTISYRFGGDWDVYIKVAIGENVASIKSPLYFTKDNKFVNENKDEDDSYYRIKELVTELKRKAEENKTKEE